MRVATLSYHNCIRVFKETVALSDVGVQFLTVLHRMANSELRSRYDALSFYDNEHEYEYKLLRLVDVDILHVHNEPNWLGTIAKRLRPDLPVVFDAHDLDSIRQGQIVEEERECFDRLDGFIFPSIGYFDTAVELFDLDIGACRVVYSMCPLSVFPTTRIPKLGGICYEGGVETVPRDEPDFMGRDYRFMACYLRDAGIPFVIYGANEYYRESYIPTGALCHRPHSYDHLLHEMQRHYWGLVGSQVKCTQRDNAMPNKLFEYLAAGLPVIVMNAKEAGEFVERHGVGVYLENVDDIKKVYGDHKKYASTVADKRMMFSMESQTEKIMTLYEYAKENSHAKSSVGMSSRGLGECGVRVCEGTEECRCAFCDGVLRETRVHVPEDGDIGQSPS